MSKVNWSQMAKNAQATLTKHSPEILTGMGIAGFATTVALAVRATPKALILIEDEKHDRAMELEDKVDDVARPDRVTISAWDTVKLCWRCYIPTIVTGALSTVCIIGASSVNLKRNAALAAAYTMSETALKEYQDKVVETIGEKKEKAVREAVAKDKLEKDPIANREVIVTGTGITRCYDAISGRYFESNIQTIRTAESALNRRLISEMYVSLNEFYLEIGLEGTELGDQLGWKIEGGGIELNLSSHLCDDGVPALVIDYRIAPKYCYGR